MQRMTIDELVDAVSDRVTARILRAFAEAAAEYYDTMQSRRATAAQNATTEEQEGA